jgi:hypothetical protein
MVNNQPDVLTWEGDTDNRLVEHSTAGVSGDEHIGRGQYDRPASYIVIGFSRVDSRAGKLSNCMISIDFGWHFYLLKKVPGPGKPAD